MLALGAIVLMQDASLAERMRGSDPREVQRCVEELLRYLSVVQTAFPRFARCNIEIDRHPVRRGDVVICSLVAANRGPELGGSPGRVDLDRRPNQHLAFGLGAHRCLGAELARIELRIAYTALMRRFPWMQLAVAADELRFRPTSIVYGLDSLPVHLDPSATPASRT
jgi:cytochrome P450